MGARIKAERQRAGISQSELAELVGVRQQSVAKWENGGNVSTNRLEAIAAALQVPVASLLGDINEVYVSPLVSPYLIPVDEFFDNLRTTLMHVAKASEVMLEQIDQDLPLKWPDVERLLQMLEAMAGDMRSVTTDLANFLNLVRESDDTTLVKESERLIRTDLPELNRQVADAITSVNDMLQQHRNQIAYGPDPDEGSFEVAAHGADADEQTVAPARSPRGDAPTDQEDGP